jgi:uncharacterized protein
MAFARRRFAFFGTAVLAVVLVPTALTFYTDWLWFGETGYQPIFLRTLTAQSQLAAAGIGIAFAVLYASVMVAIRTLTPRDWVLVTREGPISISLDRRRLQPIAGAVCAVIALLFGLWAAGQWRLWLMFRHAQPFGESDPVLGYDIGFYLFRLPFLDVARGYLFALLLVSVFAAGAVYVLAGALNFRGRARVARPARQHLAALAAALLLLFAFRAYLEVPEMLLRPAGIVHGVSNVDAAVRIPVQRALTVVAAIGAGLALLQMTSASWWPVAAALGLYMLVAVGGSVAASAMQRFVVAPNEQVRETPYIEHNIAATRKAFGLDRVEERQLSGDSELTRRDIDANGATLGNVSLWDHQPLLQTFAQIQEIRTYYDFVSVHNDRYRLNGQYRQIMVSARELASESLPNRNWINEHLTFTHGYGVTLGPVNQVTPEGLPVLFIKDLPPQSSVDLRIDEPSIYYGQVSNEYVFVKTAAREFHYPKGDDNVYTSYEGTGGVPVANLFRRLLFSARFRSMKILLSEDITNDSRVMFHRQISERVAKIAPFLRLDADPYLVISNGRLFWIQDAYTISGRYPYSTPATNGINYIRNSVKATIDAFNGTVRFYLIDETDPIALTYRQIFPDLFRPVAEMPEDMRTRMRYPEGIFAVQAAMYATYHMTNPSVFYNKEDLWEVPALDADPRPQAMQPYYTIMRLPGEREAEFIQMLPFTPARKDNLASWMVSRSDGEHYGRMMVFQFPKQKVVFGPRQIIARINQDQEISPQITLWNQQGSEVLMGTLLVIPIEESLLYIRPLYLRSAGGRIPELKRVIVAHQNHIVMEPTLEMALNRIFSRAGSPAPQPGQIVPTTAPTEGAPVVPSMPASEDLSARARDHYERAMQAQREGNWALYGEEIRKLGEVLEQMRQR